MSGCSGMAFDCAFGEFLVEFLPTESTQPGELFLAVGIQRGWKSDTLPFCNRLEFCLRSLVVLFKRLSEALELRIFGFLPGQLGELDRGHVHLCCLFDASRGIVQIRGLARCSDCAGRIFTDLR